MKALKFIILIIVILVAVVLIVAAFLPSTYKVERQAMIKAAPETINEYITDLHKWDLWSPWKSTDTAAIYEYNDTIGKGGWMSWKGEIVGAGKLTLNEVTAEKIGYHLVFTDPWSSESNGGFTLAKSDEGVLVTWMDEGSLPWPMGRIMGLFMDFDKTMGPDFEKGLAKLKEVCEAAPSNEFTILEKEVETQLIAVIRKKVAMGEIGNALGEMYGEIMAYIGANGAQSTGYPMAITIAYDSLFWDFEAAIPIDKEIKGNERIQIKQSYAGKAVYLEYKGAYENTYNAYISLDEYMAKNGLKQAGGPWEVYVTDPMTEPDTSKWITEIYFPVE
jgi:effector-binding domain-containing protein